MATNNEDKDGGILDDAPASNGDASDGDRVFLEDIVGSIQRRYQQFIDGTEGLESPQAQVVIFGDVARRMAEAGIGLGQAMAVLGRAYGIQFTDIEVTDEQGRHLVRQAQQADVRPVRGLTHRLADTVPDKGNGDNEPPFLVPGSQRGDH